MSGIYNEIQAALDGHLNTWAVSVDLSVAWENIAYEPTITEAFVKPAILPAQPSTASLGENGLNRLTGVYQVSLFYPAWEGSGTARDTADSLISHFKRGTSLTSGGVTIEIERAWRSPAVQEPDWYQIPVSIAWFTYHENV